MNYRIGYGLDVHRFTSGDSIRIGGISIPFDRGILAHSDGDVLLHAICDAMFGAAKLRDIGFHFPDNDLVYSNIDSRILLEKTLNKISGKGFKIANIDATVVAQRPKLKDYIPEMEKTIAGILDISEEVVNIKATTTEKLGFEGREEGISAHAVVLLYKN